MGGSQAFGNGTDTTDVYKLEEVIEEVAQLEKVADISNQNLKIAKSENTTKKYEVVYYGTSVTDIRRLGYLVDNYTEEIEDYSYLFDVEEDGTLRIKNYLSYYDAKNERVTLTDENGEIITNLVIPSKINGKQVLKIPPACFSNIVNLETIKLPKGLKEIEHQAFINFKCNVTIDVPDSVDKIERYAFYMSDVSGDYLMKIKVPFNSADAKPSGWEDEWADDYGVENHTIEIIYSNN